MSWCYSSCMSCSWWIWSITDCSHFFISCITISIMNIKNNCYWAVIWPSHYVSHYCLRAILVFSHLWIISVWKEPGNLFLLIELQVKPASAQAKYSLTAFASVLVIHLRSTLKRVSQSPAVLYGEMGPFWRLLKQHLLKALGDCKWKITRL